MVCIEVTFFKTKLDKWCVLKKAINLEVQSSVRCRSSVSIMYFLCMICSQRSTAGIASEFSKFCILIQSLYISNETPQVLGVMAIIYLRFRF